MSLINEALKQARAQATQTPAQAPVSIPVYTQPDDSTPDKKIGPVLIGIGVIVALVVLGGGGGLFYMYTHSKKTPVPPAPVTAAATFPGRPPKLLEFDADWCEPCKKMKPAIEEFTRDYSGRVVVEIVNIDTNPALAEKYGVKAVPMQVYLDADGKELYRNVGRVEKDGIVAKWAEFGVAARTSAAVTASLPTTVPGKPAGTGESSRVAVTHYGKLVQQAKSVTARVKDNVNEREGEMRDQNTIPVTAVAAAPTPTSTPTATAPAPVTTAKPAVPAPLYKLTGIIGGKGNYMALVNNQILRAGDKLGDGKILAVEATQVTVKSGDGTIVELRLNVN